MGESIRALGRLREGLFDNLLGNEVDAIVAARIGCTVEAVRARRVELRIAPAPRGLTVVMRETLLWWLDFTLARLYQPTVREAAEHFGVTSSAIAWRLRSLRRYGYVEGLSGREAESRAQRFTRRALAYWESERGVRLRVLPMLGHECRGAIVAVGDLLHGPAEPDGEVAHGAA